MDCVVLVLLSGSADVLGKQSKGVHGVEDGKAFSPDLSTSPRQSWRAHGLSPELEIGCGLRLQLDIQ